MFGSFAIMMKGLTEGGVIHNSGEISTAVGLVVWVGMPIVFYCVLWLIDLMLLAKN